MRCWPARRPSSRTGRHTPYFDGCLPIEVMAERGRETLRHGPMKPVGLTNPHRPDEKPYAVVQLRQDNALGTLWNMVGFQTKLKHGEQTRDLPHHPRPGAARSSPGSAACTATPSSTRRSCSTATLRLKAEPRLRFAGQITGVRGLCRERRHRPARRALRRRRAAGRAPRAAAADHGAGRAARPHHRRPSRRRRRPRSFQPMNINYGLFPPLAPAPTRQDGTRHAQKDRRLSARALTDLGEWWRSAQLD